MLLAPYLHQQPVQMLQLGPDCTAIFSQLLHISTKALRQDVEPE